MKKQSDPYIREITRLSVIDVFLTIGYIVFFFFALVPVLNGGTLSTILLHAFPFALLFLSSIPFRIQIVRLKRKRYEYLLKHDKSK